MVYNCNINFIIHASIADTSLLLDFQISNTRSLATINPYKVNSSIVNWCHSTYKFVNRLSSTFFLFFREFADPNTVFGYYISVLNLLEGSTMYWVFFASTIGFFISLSIYVDAFSDDFQTIIAEMDDEIHFENEKYPTSRAHKKNSNVKLLEAISLHNEMIKYFSSSIFTS